ncbi:tryptophan synthase subunit beta [Thiospirochaeta perfilievii]|uniref:Tryptophan synthase beta chain n=1 Tax=Thiospirochaeta perfilievii TaxID=252967 RepID=A0A5C1QIR2_9SPIO|nr:tryptophan synthase subunit beta [Thiospirochaeta perfilievii]QEN06072.1 tryptophan synthase subunit beta [Thiospirochaeta perfilievii]
MKKYNNFFGRFGGRYVAEVLREPLRELEDAYKKYIVDTDFIDELNKFAKDFIGRPTPLLFAENSTNQIGGGQIYIKLEGLANTGAHKINNAVGQALLAKRMGKTRVIAETGAGQHGVATAAACARLGLECVIYMGAEDIRRQHPNVYWMELYGAKVVSVESGSKTLKDAVNEALRDWSGSFNNTHYIIGSALGPSPYPDMVREFQSVIGREVKEQAKDLDIAVMVACVGGGSNAIGFFEPFLEMNTPRLVGVEAGGKGSGLGENAIRMTDSGKDGIVQGYKSKFLIDSDGQLSETHSISAGLDYPGIGPQLANLGEIGRVEFTSINDNEALEALKFFARNEGVIFAMESSHAGAAAIKIAKGLPKNRAIIVNMSGRGDKDIFISAKALDEKPWKEFLMEESK